MRAPSFIAAVSLVMATTSPAADHKVVSGIVVAVDVKERTIRLDGEEFEVGRRTRITIDGNEARIDRIKVGVRARVTYDPGLGVATRIDIGTGGEPGGEATRKAMSAIQGEWVTVEEELKGKPAAKAAVKATNRRITIRGNSFTMSRVVSGRLGTYTGKFEIDAPSGSFDFVGKNPVGAYMEFRGIYEVKGDRLRLCYRYARDEKVERPTEFKTDDRSGVEFVLLTLRRDADE